MSVQRHETGCPARGYYRIQPPVFVSPPLRPLTVVFGSLEYVFNFGVLIVSSSAANFEALDV